MNRQNEEILAVRTKAKARIGRGLTLRDEGLRSKEDVRLGKWYYVFKFETCKESIFLKLY